MSDRRAAVVTFGCKVNQAESDTIIAHLGPDVAIADAAEATVVVINTCTVTAEADRKVRKAVRHALDLPNAPLVVVTGCMAGVDPDAVRALGERVIVEADKARIPERVRAALGVGGDGRATGAVVPGTRTRAQVKVEDGCDGSCTYCIVPRARGVPRPVPLGEIVAQVEACVAAGVAEVVLTGINIGRYRDGGTRLPDVVDAVAATGVRRIRLSSIEPGDLDDTLLQVLADTPAFCRHLHVPLQSGADAVLARMGRPYDTVAFAARIAAARDALPGVALTTDVIAGFPGESDGDAHATEAFIEECGFARLHVFRYSRRPGTPAAEMTGVVPAGVAALRAASLRALNGRLHEADVLARVGSVAEMLVERVITREGRRVAEGVTREYVRVRTDGAGRTPGEIQAVTITGWAGEGVAAAAPLAGE